MVNGKNDGRQEYAGSPNPAGSAWSAGTLAAAAAAYYGVQDMNCSEALLRAANDAFQLDLDEQGLRLAAPFGGGMGIESVCGALTGALMALANLYVEQRAHESDRMKALSAEFLRGFEKAHGSIICRELKDRYHTDAYGCREVVGRAAAFLETFLSSHEKERLR